MTPVIRSLLAAVLLSTPPQRQPNDPAMNETLTALDAFHATVRRFTLDNGMTVLLRPDPATKIVSIQVWVGVGSIHEEEFLGSGLCHFIEHLIFKGTPSRPVGQITREINDAGGHVNAYTSYDRTVFHAEMPAHAWTTGLDVLADAVQNAAFPEDEWEREREVILREVAMGKDEPTRVLHELLWRTAFTVHPYRFPIIGLPDVLQQVRREDILRFFQRAYVPDRMIVVIAGDIVPEEAEARVRAAFAAFNRKPNAPFLLPTEPPQLSSRSVRQEGPYHVSRLIWAWHTVPLAHPDAAALDLLAEILGGGRSARLTRNLVERQRLADAISAHSFTPKEAGLFAVSAVFPPDREEALRAGLESEWRSWEQQTFTPEEIARARRSLTAQTLEALETATGQADSLASGEFYAADFRYAAHYLERLNAVTPESLQSVVRTYLRPENRTEALLVPANARSVATPPPPVQPGLVERVELPNGIQLLVRTDNRLPFVSVCAALRGGVLDETEDQNGLFRLMADMLTRGTETRTSETIAETIESLGASLSTFSGFHCFGLQGRCFRPDLPILLEVLADCLLHSQFPADEVEKQKALQIATIRQQRDRPFYIASRELFLGLFPGHPFRLDPAGEEETVRTLDTHRLRETFERVRAPRNLTLALFGAITRDDAIRLVEPLFAELRGEPPTPLTLPPPTAALPGRKERLLPRQQTILMIGYPDAPLRSPDREPLQVLAMVLSGLSSRVMEEIREKRGLAYFAGAFERVTLDLGAFVLYAGTRDDALEEVESLLRQELQRIRTEGPSPDEVERAKALLISSHYEELQDNRRLAVSCATHERIGLGAEYVLTTEQRIRAVTPEAVRQAARTWLAEERSFASIVRPQTPDAPTAP